MSPHTGMRSHDQWCLEPACQSDSDAATDSQIVAPGLPGSTQSRSFYPQSSLGEGPQFRDRVSSEAHHRVVAHLEGDGGQGELCPSII
jgi:hypothetical protein